VAHHQHTLDAIPEQGVSQTVEVLGRDAAARNSQDRRVPSEDPPIELVGIFSRRQEGR
jgi:hypothetical protein